jgi:hypothetical protein
MVKIIRHEGGEDLDNMHLEAEGKFQYCLCQFIRSITLGGKFFKNFPLYRVLIAASVLSRIWYLL